MKRPTREEMQTVPTRQRSRARLSRLLLGLAAAGGLALTSVSADACDYCDSVEVDCPTCTPSCGVDGCDSIGCDGMGIGHKCGRVGGGLFRALDAVAGGVEKIMGFDKCGQGGCGSSGCDSVSCDGGCDAMYAESMMPMESVDMGMQRHSHAYAPTPPAPIYTTPTQMPSPPMAAPRMAAPRVVAPQQPQFRMSEPMIVSPQSEPDQVTPAPNDSFDDFGAVPEPAPRNVAPRTPAPRMVAPRTPAPRTPAPVDRLPAIEQSPAPTPAPIPEPVPAKTPPSDGGGLFDSLDDPFGDDVRALPRQQRVIRPSNYRKTQLSAPIRLHAPQASTGTNQHIQKAAMQQRTAMQNKGVQPRVGSSFRDYNQAVAPTRQVSHQHASDHSVLQQPQLAPAPAPRRQAVQHSAHQHVHQAKAPVSQPHRIQATGPRLQATGQRHSSAGYSGYGHTTNRR